MNEPVAAALQSIVVGVIPGGEILDVQLLEPDASGAGATSKSVGYGAPLKLRVKTREGSVKTLVFHTATPNAFGHDRRADRAAEMLLAYDTFASVPAHVA